MAQEALAELCAGYWDPIYALIRRRGRAPEEALDLVQAPGLEGQVEELEPRVQALRLSLGQPSPQALGVREGADAALRLRQPR